MYYLHICVYVNVVWSSKVRVISNTQSNSLWQFFQHRDKKDFDTSFVTEYFSLYILVVNPAMLVPSTIFESLTTFEDLIKIMDSFPPRG